MLYSVFPEAKNYLVAKLLVYYTGHRCALALDSKDIK